jgi:hypothetical protein
MAWIVGIDEAGYGPNLGPFVMSAVACRTPDEHAGRCLWQALSPFARRGRDGKDGRLVVDDSKVVYSTGRGLAGLERGLFALFALEAPLLEDLVARLCPDDRAELTAEAWYTGGTALPVDAGPAELHALRDGAGRACEDAALGPWHAFSLVVCPPRFNALVDRAGSKSAVLAHAFVRLLGRALQVTAGEEPLAVWIDKQGGRNSYAAQIQEALPGGMVVPLEESPARSAYWVRRLGRDVRLTFQPRADQEHFCVALASMASKYLRELFMGEFNRFWQRHVPGLKATAGYPGDAGRFLDAIRPAAAGLGIAEAAIWRRK